MLLSLNRTPLTKSRDYNEQLKLLGKGLTQLLQADQATPTSSITKDTKRRTSMRMTRRTTSAWCFAFWLVWKKSRMSAKITIKDFSQPQVMGAWTVTLQWLRCWIRIKAPARWALLLKTITIGGTVSHASTSTQFRCTNYYRTRHLVSATLALIMFKVAICCIKYSEVTLVWSDQCSKLIILRTLNHTSGTSYGVAGHASSICTRAWMNIRR